MEALREGIASVPVDGADVRRGVDLGGNVTLADTPYYLAATIEVMGELLRGGDKKRRQQQQQQVVDGEMADMTASSPQRQWMGFTAALLGEAGSSLSSPMATSSSSSSSSSLSPARPRAIVASATTIVASATAYRFYRTSTVAGAAAAAAVARRYAPKVAAATALLLLTRRAAMVVLVRAARLKSRDSASGAGMMDGEVDAEAELAAAVA